MKIIDTLNKLDERLGFRPRKRPSAKQARLWWVWCGIGFIAVGAGLVLNSYEVATSWAAGLLSGGAFYLWLGGYLQGLHHGLQEPKPAGTSPESERRSGQDVTE